MKEDMKTQAISYLSRHLYGNLATISAEDPQQPHASTIAYFNDGLDLYFATDLKTEKLRNISKNRRVSLTVDEDEADWSRITGLQIEGEAEVLPAEKVAALVPQFLAKFPYAKTLPPNPDSRFIRIVSKKIWVINYGKAFGHRDYFEVQEKELRGAKAA
jgi:nitroimidazol reductase NimA-like FMN-containing flavoprotein (pyridoxamine 5'-phosphate oxidase superfamily)